ncbi:LysR family transcriptional regulator [Marinobacter sp. MMG032]|uniref:LysR family transcriptional regulator n=1 Tax=Marinobacter sp. MMG032 TaxID=3158548 RepID=A0AAU7MSD5_9GAMM
MDTRHIRHFMALVECGSFARACEVVHLSQPALSRSIQELERQLGARLFDRGRFGVVLTAHGRAALPHVRGLLAAAESLRQEVEAIDELETGELSIGTGPYPALALMDRVCARFVDRYPAIRLNIRTDNWQELRLALLDHEIELFVADTGELSGDPDLEITHLPQPEVVVFCRHDHPLTREEAVVWGDLLDYPLAMTRLPEDMERKVQTMSAQQGGLKRRIECDNIAMLAAIVSGSKAISIAPRPIVAGLLNSGKVKTLPVTGIETLQTRYGLLQRSGRPLSPAAVELRSMVLELANLE